MRRSSRGRRLVAATAVVRDDDLAVTFGAKKKRPMAVAGGGGGDDGARRQRRRCSFGGSGEVEAALDILPWVDLVVGDDDNSSGVGVKPAVSVGGAAAKDSLPESYVLLEEMFSAIDCVLVFAKLRRQTGLGFPKVASAVEQSCGRAFTKRHLAQLVYLWPEAFLLRQQRCVAGAVNAAAVDSRNGGVQGREGGAVTFQLIVELNRGGGGGGGGVDAMDTLPSPPRARWSKKSSPAAGDGSHAAESKNVLLMTRRTEMRTRLIALVATHHERFLRERGFKAPAETSTMWHPSFHFADLPPVPVAELPRTPNFSLRSAANIVQHLQEKRDDRLRAIPALLLSVGGGDDDDDNDEGGVAPSQQQQQQQKQQKRAGGVSASAAILQRIREKKARRDAEDRLDGGREGRRRRTLIGHLPHLLLMIRSHFLNAGRCVSPLGQLANTLALTAAGGGYSGGSTVSCAEMTERLRMLATIAPEWCAIGGVDGANGRTDEMFRVIERADFGAVQRKVQTERDRQISHEAAATVCEQVQEFQDERRRGGR